VGEILKYFMLCGRSDVTPTIASGSVAAHMAVKWWLNTRSILCVKGPFHKLCNCCSKGFLEDVMKFLHVRNSVGSV